MSSKRALATVVVIAAGVAILTVAAVSAPRTTPTTIDPSGNTVKIDSAANAVKIDSSANTVKIDSATTPVNTFAAHNAIQLWTSDQVITAGNTLYTSTYSTVGYRQISVVLASSLTSYQSAVTVGVAIGGPASGCWIGYGNFGTPTHSPTDQANFAVSAGICAFTMPVMGTYVELSIHNGTASSVTLHSANSFIYLNS